MFSSSRLKTETGSKILDISFLIRIIPLEEFNIDDDKVKTLKNRLSRSSKEFIVLLRSNKVSISRYFSFKSLFK